MEAEMDVKIKSRKEPKENQKPLTVTFTGFAIFAALIFAVSLDSFFPLAQTHSNVAVIY
jgi:hypothetical protein